MILDLFLFQIKVLVLFILSFNCVIVIPQLAYDHVQNDY